jgi:hypothetical protein
MYTKKKKHKRGRGREGGGNWHTLTAFMVFIRLHGFKTDCAPDNFV